jgi:hyperpolarization activated cyclic nucleotide-gated potassium channel 2
VIELALIDSVRVIENGQSSAEIIASSTRLLKYSKMMFSFRMLRFIRFIKIIRLLRLAKLKVIYDKLEEML